MQNTQRQKINNTPALAFKMSPVIISSITCSPVLFMEPPETGRKRPLFCRNSLAAWRISSALRHWRDSGVSSWVITEKEEKEISQPQTEMILGLETEMDLEDERTRKASVLSLLLFFSSIQVWMSERQVSRKDIADWMFDGGKETWSWVSFAKDWHLIEWHWIKSERGFVERMKRIGPNTEHCGTP